MPITLTLIANSEGQVSITIHPPGEIVTGVDFIKAVAAVCGGLGQALAQAASGDTGRIVPARKIPTGV